MRSGRQFIRTTSFRDHNHQQRPQKSKCGGSWTLLLVEISHYAIHSAALGNGPTQWVISVASDTAYPFNCKAEGKQPIILADQASLLRSTVRACRHRHPRDRFQMPHRHLWEAHNQTWRLSRHHKQTTAYGRALSGFFTALRAELNSRSNPATNDKYAVAARELDQAILDVSLITRRVARSIASVEATLNRR